ncbi:NUDIX domain-containing protein [Paenibacillaceae bacterium WGS1546]|uniref:NUDIX hydrolase n=1 Tax=Cohnella sp. WGS1546 TaxID=3366810 RepID=UPI00372D57C3
MNETIDSAVPLTGGAHAKPYGVHADVVLFTIASEERQSPKKTLPYRELQVVLLRRTEWPYEGGFALPGGFAKENESIRECACRVLRTETGVAEEEIDFFNEYSDPGRDPRGWVVSHGFFALVNEADLAEAISGRDDVLSLPVSEALGMPLAFDQRAMVSDALRRLRRLVLTTTIARRLLPEEFTISELYQVIEAVVPDFEEKNFIRKLISTRSRKGILEEARAPNGEPKTSNRHSQRAARLYRFTDFEPRLSIYG